MLQKKAWSLSRRRIATWSLLPTSEGEMCGNFHTQTEMRGSRGTWRQKSRESRWNLDGLKDRYFLGRCRQQRKLQWRQGQQLQSRIERSPLSTFAQPWVVYYVFLRITRLQSYYYCCGVFHNGRELSFAHAA